MIYIFSFDKKALCQCLIVFLLLFIVLDRQVSFRGAKMIATVSKKLGLINVETFQY